MHPVKKDLTQKYVKELLNYDPATGFFSWCVPKRKKYIASNQNGKYQRIDIDGQKYLAHRIAWLYVYGKFPDNEIDHINFVKHDNRITNLRDVTHRVNAGHRQPKPSKEMLVKKLSIYQKEYLVEDEAAIFIDMPVCSLQNLRDV